MEVIRENTINMEQQFCLLVFVFVTIECTFLVIKKYILSSNFTVIFSDSLKQENPKVGSTAGSQ